MSSSEEIKAEYMSSLADLTFNSRPLINVLTMLAEENSPNAPVIVEAIEEHLSKVNTDVKLPILYLIDCIVKTVGGIYTSLFNHNIVNMFIGVFKAVDEKTRAEMFKLRQTWNEVFPQMKLYAIDVQISLLDPAWPVTAKPPSNSIHLNPRFLKNAPPSSTPTIKTEPESSPSDSASPSVNKETLIMQEQLIQKQRELLELQQKKLELEVLQTRVKLQEQYKNNQPQTGRPHNILLKPEVAKQLVPSLAQHKQNLVNTAMVQQLAQPQAAPTNGTKINPVSSALINAKPIRDPRLLRQQQKRDQTPSADGNLENQLHQRTALLETNKIVSNKNSVRKHRNDPRLINKDDTSNQRSDSSKPNHSSKSRSSESAHHKSHKTSRSSSQRGQDTSSLKSSSNSVSIDSSKVKSDLVKSPVKNKKKEKSDRRPLSREKPGKNDSSPVSNSTTFKNVSMAMKNRNYVRKKVGSASPEAVKDEDLRSFGPPEKQPRLESDSNDTISAAPVSKAVEPLPVAVMPPSATMAPKTQSTILPTSAKDQDVDLRQLPAMVTKKRSSTEISEDVSMPAKKTKTQIFDKLFGDEDTDLRQQLAINTEQRPKTPPPPIISVSATETKTASPKMGSPKSNFDAVRAKLANATNRDKVLSKSYKKKPKLEDQDLRPQATTGSPHKTKIIISPEEETSIKSGKMTNEEGSELLNRIILQVEKRKLKEAKRKDHEESFNVSLQPISDDDLSDTELEKEETNTEGPVDAVMSNESVPERPPISEESLIPFKDKDERLNSGPPPPPSEFVGHFFPRDGRDTRRFPGPHWRGRGGRRWEPIQPMMSARPWNSNNWAPVEEFTPALEEMEPIFPNGHVNADEVKSITIDSVSRDIRFYGETAIVFIGWDDPRELTFQNAGVRKITFNDKDSFVLNFNDDYKEVYCNGNSHIVRLGAPSRELFIDNVPYECFFGSPGIRIELDGVPTKVHLEGPPPPVNIGKVKRCDLVAGKINMFVDAIHVVPVFLDAKVQKFVLQGQTSTLKFVDALKTVLINDVPFDIEYGGLPKPLFIHGKKHFVRFSVLPRDIRPGKVRLLDMDFPEDTRAADENSQDVPLVTDAYDPAMPISGTMDKPVGSDSPDRNSNSPNSVLKSIQQNNLDVLSNALSSSTGPAPVSGGYQIENQNSQDSQASSQPFTTLPPILNINEIFQNLVASGLVKSSPPSKPVEEPPKVVESPKKEMRIEPEVPAATSTPNVAPSKLKKTVLSLKPVTFNRPETLRVRQNSLYAMLYSGMQCSTCGMRFSPEASMLYSQHLDWHFRQNRRGKRNSRVATSRRWYYSLADWKNYEELEDLEEREKNYFDEQKQAEGGNEDAEEEVEVPSVAADPDSTDECCMVCREKFDQFFNEEKEEWHLRNAIRMENKTYHPVCYEDYQNSLLEQTLDESKAPEEIEQPQEESVEKIIPGLEIIIDDDDDIPEEVNGPLSNEILSVESDDSKLVPEATEMPEYEQQEAAAEGDDDDDVILNEVAPIKIVVDDDDDEIAGERTNVASPPPAMDTEDDGFVEIAGLLSLPNGKHVKIKAEPVDKEDIPTTPVAEDLSTLTVESSDLEIVEPKPTQHDVASSLDGNADPFSGVTAVGSAALGGNKIKINISKPLPVINKEKENNLGNDLVPSETYIDPFEPFPPGEEPQPAALKTALRSARLSKLPPVRKGTELTGLCSLM
ncbi:pre-mRNA cleavage complex 2 protein Pcf11 isoform X2 [Diabrotica virgifera virgifera]|uniref:Pre-mRNA cleavage complex 2 protein Pcf11 isoform X2 n=1 Tax=Diabrotica virgifera virgifera TaxID=50390 RepID=A0A6P7FP85_DIAVI|nr:pre-mRNA cleavage complex 2 protein Pcf11 isoform X2 [Diabrotica virgifera virgifera]